MNEVNIKSLTHLSLSFGSLNTEFTRRAGTNKCVCCITWIMHQLDSHKQEGFFVIPRNYMIFQKKTDVEE